MQIKTPKVTEDQVGFLAPQSKQVWRERSKKTERLLCK